MKASTRQPQVANQARLRGQSRTRDLKTVWASHLASWLRLQGQATRMKSRQGRVLISTKGVIQYRGLTIRTTLRKKRLIK